MAKDIIIQNDGVAVTYTGAKKLKTRKSTGGTLYWLPEDEVQRGTINITENGTYKASTAGVYAFSRANVNVANSTHVTGKGQDGNMYDVTVDPETGDIVRTEVPAKMEITTPPPRVSYSDGDTIDYSGIVVTLYDGNGNVFTDSRYPDGIVPFSELVFPVDKAHYEGGGGVSSDLDTSPVPQPIQVVDGAFSTLTRYRTSGHEHEDERVYIPLAGVMSRILFFRLAVDDELIRTFFASDTLGKIGTLRVRKWRDGDLIEETYRDIKTERPAEIHSKTAYWYWGSNVTAGNTENVVDFPYTMYIIPNNSGNSDNIAWTMVYGTGGGAGTQTLPVNWISPYNADTYTDTFDIVVHDGSGSAD